MKKRLYMISAICALCIGMTGCGDSKAPARSTGSEPESSSAGQSSAAEAESGAESAAEQSSEAETQPATETQPAIPDILAHYDELQDGEYVQVNDIIRGEENLTIDQRLANGPELRRIGISISGSQFQIKKPGSDTLGTRTYSGSVTQSGDKLCFDYQNLQWDFSNAPQHTQERLIRQYGVPAINVSVSETYSEDDNRYSLKEQMLKWSNSGAFCQYQGGSIHPSINYIRNDPRYNAYPLYCDLSYLEIENYDDIILKVKNDFLCIDTYGFTIKGQYTKGGAFSLNYNYKEAMEDNPNSCLYLMDGTINDNMLPWMQDQLDDSGIDCNTTIDFANGEWTWKNSSGNLINNGVYTESEKYPGLIEMKLTEQSKVNNASYSMYSAIFYIADDGKIYYPSFIKAE